MLKIKLLVLADDLTGALDTGIQFAKNKISVKVLPSVDKLKNKIPDAEVLVINTNTRHCTPAEAKNIVSSCVGIDAEYIYKKTDSTLRGNIGAELEAVMEARNTKQLPFVPAYPALGRTTKNGNQFLDGKPINETEMAFDSLNPVKTSFIPDIIKVNSDVESKIIKKGESIQNKTGEKEILVFDAETKEDLNDIALDLFGKNMLYESAGCAGFAEALKNILPLKKETEGEPFQLNYGQLPVLIVSGSLHSASIKQIKTAMELFFPRFAVSGKSLVQANYFETGEAKFLISSVIKKLKSQKLCILGTEMSFGFGKLKMNLDGKNVSYLLGKLVKQIKKEIGPLVLVVSGGDTLMGILENSNCFCLIPVKELQNGVVMSAAEETDGDSVIISKSGAFGNPNFLIEIMKELKKN